MISLGPTPPPRRSYRAGWGFQGEVEWGVCPRVERARAVGCCVSRLSRETAREVLALCRGLGVGLAGWAGVGRAGLAAASPSAWGAELRAWLGAGKRGAMGYLAEHVEARLDPSRVLAGARSVVMVADFYSQRGGDEGPLAAGSGRVARY